MMEQSNNPGYCINCHRDMRPEELDCGCMKDDGLFQSPQHLMSLLTNQSALALEALQLSRTALKHTEPDDCWSTGPSTGNFIEDLIVCPGCRANHAIDAAIALLSLPEPEVMNIKTFAYAMTDEQLMKMTGLQVADLPPLPSAQIALHPHSKFTWERATGWYDVAYTADQMHQYALASVRALAAPKEG